MPGDTTPPRAIREFHKQCRGAIEAVIVTRHDAPALTAALMLGDPKADVVVGAIETWLGGAATKKHDHSPLCLGCDTRFHRDSPPPTAFVLAIPFASPSCAMVSGVCGACAEREADLLAMAMRFWRQIWPTMYRTDAGQG